MTTANMTTLEIAQEALDSMFGNGCIETEGMSDEAIADQIEAQLQFTLEDMGLELSEAEQSDVLSKIEDIRG
jgi:hypothetical protein